MIKSPFIRSPFNYDVEEASNASAYVETMPSLTVQSMTEDADLNVLMKRFGVTGKMPEDVRQPSYGDFSHVTDYRSAIDAVRLAEDSFMQFPANIRAQFENNPQLFLDFVENPGNIEQVKKWFPKENLGGETAVGNVASQGSVASASGGGGTPQRDAGAGVPERSGEPGSSQSGTQGRSA